MADLFAGNAFQSGSGGGGFLGAGLSLLCDAAVCTAFNLSARLPGWSPAVGVAELLPVVEPSAGEDGESEGDPGVEGGVVEGASEEDAGAERLHPAIGRLAKQRRSK